MKPINFKWNNREYTIALGQRPLVIAEAGVNHNGNLKLAKELVDIARAAGADFVKFQTFHVREMTTPSGPSAQYIKKGSPKAESWYKLLEQLALPDEAFEEISNYCKKKGIVFLATPYDEKSVDLLDRIGIPLFKVASTDTNNIPLIEYIAKKKKPIIISTGLSTFKEVKETADACRRLGNNNLVVMQCTSNYPASIQSANIRVISSYRDKLNVLVGYSDHTIGELCATLAVGQGAIVIERHFTKDKRLPGPDQKASSSPKELINYINTIHDTYVALGNGVKKVTSEEVLTKRVMQKSLTSVRDINAGEIIKRKDILIRRPATGLPPKRLKEVIGKKAFKNIKADTPIKESDIAW